MADPREKEMGALLRRLFPIHRSITGKGVRETLRMLKKYIPLKVHEVGSGTKALDWRVPDEWNIKDAYIKDPSGKKVIDFKQNNLHVLNYSIPIRAKMPLAELSEHIHTLPAQPGLIPYKTSYYKRNWGFCMTERQKKKLVAGTYEVVIDSSLEKGSLTYGELVIAGRTKEEILFSTYVCHPSMANDNVSGPVLLSMLARHLLKLKRKKLRYTYRFIFIPETIGSIVWLSRNRPVLGRIAGGLVATCVGDKGPLTYKRSRRGATLIDRAVENALARPGKKSKIKYRVMDLDPAAGSDERQFCSPGFDLPVGSLMRTPYGRYPEYHTSGDDLSVVRPKYLRETLDRYIDTVAELEDDEYYESRSPFGEPQLGRRGLYSAIGPAKNEGVRESAMLTVLNYSDGAHNLSWIARHSGLPLKELRAIARILVLHRLIRRGA